MSAVFAGCKMLKSGQKVCIYIYHYLCSHSKGFCRIYTLGCITCETEPMPFTALLCLPGSSFVVTRNVTGLFDI